MTVLATGLTIWTGTSVVPLLFVLSQFFNDMFWCTTFLAVVTLLATLVTSLIFLICQVLSIGVTIRKVCSILTFFSVRD